MFGFTCSIGFGFTSQLNQNSRKRCFKTETLDSVVLEQVKDADEIGGVKVAKLEVKSAPDIEQIMPLLKLRHAILAA